MREIIRASAWGGFADLVAEMGGDPQRILATAQVDPAALVDGERYLPLRQFVECQAIAAEVLKRKDFGLAFGQKQNISMLGALALAIVNSPTVRHAIEIAGRYMHVHNPASRMTLAPMPRTTLEFVTCEVLLRESSRREQNDECVISSVHKSLRTVGGDVYRPRAIWFTHAPMSPMRVYSSVFGIQPLFNQPAMGIALERSVMDSRLSGGSEEMRRIAEAYLIQHAMPRELLYAQSVASMARSLLRGGEFTPEQTANALGLHARTLQRRLREEGSSFETIKDNARREWAESLLLQPSVSLTTIAEMLGYADPSAFSRSCRRWFGEAPRTYRARLTARRPARQGPRASRVNTLEANLRARRRADV